MSSWQILVEFQAELPQIHRVIQVTLVMPLFVAINSGIAYRETKRLIRGMPFAPLSVVFLHRLRSNV